MESYIDIRDSKALHVVPLFMSRNKQGNKNAYRVLGRFHECNNEMEKCINRNGEKLPTTILVEMNQFV